MLNDFELTPPPEMLDADPVTTDWPMPDTHPGPQPLPDDSLLMRMARLRDGFVRAVFGEQSV
jgi:hypothetical protein